MAARILGYLRDHPNAADTKFGIARWWLLQQRYQESLEQTERALTQLEKKKLVVKVPIASGEYVYQSAQRAGGCDDHG